MHLPAPVRHQSLKWNRSKPCTTFLRQPFCPSSRAAFVHLSAQLRWEFFHLHSQSFSQISLVPQSHVGSNCVWWTSATQSQSSPSACSAGAPAHASSQARACWLPTVCQLCWGLLPAGSTPLPRGPLLAVVGVLWGLVFLLDSSQKLSPCW